MHPYVLLVSLVTKICIFLQSNLYKTFVIGIRYSIYYFILSMLSKIYYKI